MTTIDRRDLSQLSAILATATTSAPKPKRIRPAPANDNKPTVPVLAWPALERLAHRGDFARAFALRHWKNLVHPGSGYCPEQGTDDSAEEVIEVRPTEAETLRAIGWTVTGQERAPEGWTHTGRLQPTYDRGAQVEAVTTRNPLGGTDTRFGDLLFRDNKLTKWGITSKGRPLKPIERPRGEKGAVQSKDRTETALWSYLALRGATSPLAAKHLHRPFSDEPAIGDFYDPLPAQEPTAKDRRGRFGVEEARAVLEALGVDGSVPFDRLPVPAVLADDGIVTGSQWVGGVKKPKPLGEISAAATYQVEQHQQPEGRGHFATLRDILGQHAKVLDMAIADYSAKDIAIALGKAPSYGEKVGPSLIDAALDALIVLDETARTKELQKIAA